MRQLARKSNFVLSTLMALTAAAVVGSISGCGDSQAEPISSENSGFKPVAAKKNSAEQQQGDGKVESSTGPTRQPSKVTDSAKKESDVAKPPVAAFPSDGKNAAGDKILSQDPVAALKKLQRTGIPNGTREQVEIQVKAMHERMLELADEVLASDAKPEDRKLALESKIQALQVLSQLGVKVDDKLSELAKALKAEDDLDLAFQGRMISFRDSIGLLQKEEPDLDKFTESLAELFKGAENLPTAFEMAQQLAGMSQQLVQVQRIKEKEFAILLRSLGKAFSTSENETFVEAAKNWTSQARDAELSLQLTELGFIEAINSAVKKEEGGVEKFNEVMDKFFAAAPADAAAFRQFESIAQQLTQSNANDVAIQIYDRLEKAFENSDDKELAEKVTQTIANAKTQIELVGEPLEIGGVDLISGDAFDWTNYQDKIVWVEFWTSEETGPLSLLQQIQQVFSSQGVEVVGINMDKDPEAARAFLDDRPLPWTSIISADEDQYSFNNPVAIKCGVTETPFSVLVGRDGKVVATGTSGQAVVRQLQRLLREDAAAAAAKEVTENGKDTTPAAPSKTEELEEKTGEPKEKPADSTQGALPATDMDLFGESAYFVSFLEDEEDDSDDDTSIVKKRNPYAASPNLRREGLIDFILDMEERPASIQKRPGFCDAVIEASDRLIKLEGSGTYWRLGVLTKCRYLHRKAVYEVKDADEELAKYVKELQGATDKRIAKELTFLDLERRALAADGKSHDDIRALLAELKTFFGDNRLNERHLRIASATVHAINLLDADDEELRDKLGDEREKLFGEFGEMFAKSTDRELKAYGKKLAKKPEAESSDLVGQQLELAGTTVDGVEFDWTSYRGKVVIVDFWATWCGPCRAAMPKVKALYEKHGDKGLEIVGISLDKDMDALNTYIDDNKIQWENLSGEGAQELARKYGVRGIPTMMLVDATGKIVGVSHSIDSLTKKAEELVAALEKK